MAAYNSANSIKKNFQKTLTKIWNIELGGGILRIINYLKTIKSYEISL